MFHIRSNRSIQARSLNDESSTQTNNGQWGNIKNLKKKKIDNIKTFCTIYLWLTKKEEKKKEEAMESVIKIDQPNSTDQIQTFWARGAKSKFEDKVILAHFNERSLPFNFIQWTQCFKITNHCSEEKKLQEPKIQKFRKYFNREYL